MVAISWRPRLTARKRGSSQGRRRACATVLILDWEMPKVDGLELCQSRIRSSERGEEAFILLVTARDKTEDLTAVLDAGADDYMSKPVTP